jgi:dGTPase
MAEPRDDPTDLDDLAELAAHDRPRAPWASDWRAGRGRKTPEPGSPTRSDFQRDRDRIVHSTAFRRLAHKTQVFVPLHGDHFRTRLTHTIEVAQIARSLARGLRLDEDLAEAVALSHDLGHTPFGHSGEDALDALMRPYGGFDHNAHALRVVTALERRYADFDGLNLSWETLEGLVKHNGPLLTQEGAPTARYAARGVPVDILAFDATFPLGLASYAGAEAQAAAIADDVAYDAHDLDDGLRAGLFSLDDLNEVEFLRDVLQEIRAWRPGLDPMRAVHELGRRVITRFVEDVLRESARRLRQAAPRSADALRALDAPVVAPSAAMAEADKAMKRFLFKRMYRHPDVMAKRAMGDEVLRDLFSHYFERPIDMPAERRPAFDDESARARASADYVAGMTDRFALSEHRRLFARTPDLR